MFTPEHDEVAGGGPYGNTSQQTCVSRKSISSNLIIRYLLEISSKSEKERDVVANDDDVDDVIEYPRHHPFPIKISTLSSTLHFSHPLREDGDDEEGESGDHIDEGNNDVTVGVSANTVDTEHPTQFIPHYQRSFDSVTTSEQEQRRMNSVEVSSASPDDEESSSCSEPNAERNFEIIGLEGDGQCSNSIDGADTVVPREAKVARGKSRDGDDGAQKPQSSNAGGTGDYFGLDDVGDCRDKGTSCDICLLTFEVGDKVAFSPNCECSHHFHKVCIMFILCQMYCEFRRRDPQLPKNFLTLFVVEHHTNMNAHGSAFFTRIVSLTGKISRIIRSFVRRPFFPLSSIRRCASTPTVIHLYLNSGTRLSFLSSFMIFFTDVKKSIQYPKRI